MDFQDDEEVMDLRTPEVFEKYKTAAEISNRVLAEVVRAGVPGTPIKELCQIGDNLLQRETAAVYTKGKLEKGIAFPTCVSVNHCVGHFSPLPDDKTVLEEGDLVKVDLGAHIDGFISQQSHSFIATSNPQQVVQGRKADAICAAYFASEAALRLFKPGKTNTEVTETIQKIADVFGCQPVEGVLSHQMGRFIIDGNNVVINKATDDQQVEEVTFQEYDVYCFDIVMSTGEGKPREGDPRKTTVFKRNLDQSYNLKIKSSRYVFSEIQRNYPALPFSLRNFKDQRRAKFGISECVQHELVEPYPVLYEKEGEYVAQFKFTALITPTQTLKLTSHPLPYVKSDHEIQDKEINQLLSMGTKRTTKKKKRRRNRRRGGGGGNQQNQQNQQQNQQQGQ